MQEFEPKIKKKNVIARFLPRYVYIAVISLCLLLGVSYSLTFFIQNKTVATGTMSVDLLINFTNRSINATDLSRPSDDRDGILMYTKSLTVTNASVIDGEFTLTLSRTSGLALTDLRYAIVVNGVVQEINDVLENGEILTSAIMAGETIDIEVRLWPKPTYTGNATTFVGEIAYESNYLGPTAVSMIESPAGKYVNFNCNGSTCEVWQIVKVENGRLVLTRQADYSGATERTDSGLYNGSLSFYDNSLITSVSTDNKNVYLAKTVRVSGGSGTSQDPYTLFSNSWREPDRRVVGTLTYTDNGSSIGTQKVYYEETHVSKYLNVAGTNGWADTSNNQYFYGGEVTHFTGNTTLSSRYITYAVNLVYDNTETSINCSEVQCALEKINAVYNYEDHGTLNNIICRRATALHTETCSNSTAGSYCLGDGYASDDTITYGNIKQMGSALAVGDAFDCKVTENGGYTERFYYVSPYYNTSTQTFDNTTATLVYYSNTVNGVASDGGSAYATQADAQSLNYTCEELNGCNWYGPISAVGNLPTTSQWNNISLKATSRTILACNSGDCDTTSTSVGGVTIENPFSYAGKSARLLTLPELKEAGCDTLSGQTSLGTNGALKACNFLFEGTKYADSSKETSGLWLENPRSNYVYNVSVDNRKIAYGTANYTQESVRPVIDVPLSKILY